MKTVLKNRFLQITDTGLATLIFLFGMAGIIFYATVKQDNISLFMGSFVLIYIMLPVNFVSYRLLEYREGFTKFTLTLPISRKKLVMAEFLLMGIVTLSIFISSGILFLALASTGISTLKEDTIIFFSLIPALSLLAQAFGYALSLKLGMEHTAFSAVVGMLTVSFFVAVIENVYGGMVKEMLSVNPVLFLLVAVSLILCFTGICYQISVILINKLEF